MILTTVYIFTIVYLFLEFSGNNKTRMKMFTAYFHTNKLHCIATTSFSGFIYIYQYTLITKNHGRNIWLFILCLTKYLTIFSGTSWIFRRCLTSHFSADDFIIVKVKRPTSNSIKNIFFRSFCTVKLSKESLPVAYDYMDRVK